MAHRGPEDFQPTKARGQNFLVDPNLARKLVDALQIEPGDTVIEIGPGTGALTRHVLAKDVNVVAIEKDHRLVEFLTTELANPRFRLVPADALTVDFASLGITGPARLISNLPYSITSPLVLKIITSPFTFTRVVVTMQKEVAERLVAPPGSRTYGRLSVVSAMAGGFTTLFDLPPTVFRPRPRVWSRALAYTPGPVDMTTYPGSWLEAVIRAAFSARRKQVAKALAEGLSCPRPAVVAALEAAGIAPTARAEELSWQAYQVIAKSLQPGAGPH
jgi:16S rRNA (adenine1518-N6/adenine1519-N6)-dimethyltransferase